MTEIDHRAPLTVDRRFVLKGSVALAGVSALTVTPAGAQQRGQEPTGQTEILQMEDNPSVDVAPLAPGEMVVVATGGVFLGILHRTSDQIAAAAATQTERDPKADAERVLDAAYLVVDLTCPHRGCQVGYRNEAAEPFACPCHRSRFDASGRVLGGPARTNLTIPPYQIEGTVVTFSEGSGSEG